MPSAVAPRCFYFQPATRPSTIVPSQNSKPISLVKSLTGGLGLKTRRPPGCLCRALRIPIFFTLLQLGYRSRLHRRVSYPTRALSRLRPLVRPKRNPRNWPENSQTPSGENSVTRYTSSSGLGPRDKAHFRWVSNWTGCNRVKLEQASKVNRGCRPVCIAGKAARIRKKRSCTCSDPLG